MVTRELVQRIMETKLEDIPREVQEHGKRSLLNWMGVAIGASRHLSVDIILDVADEFGNRQQATVLGRGNKTNLLFAALINGMSSHIFDFDDTHLDTIHHPSSPVAPVVFALGEYDHIPGDQLLRAFILGCEAELRISNAVYPSHYQRGWHITSSTGVFGSTIAAGLLLQLTQTQMQMALGIAGTQSLGFREMFGTMTKPFHPGKASQVGLEAAILAQKGFTSTLQILEAKRGFANVTADGHDLSKVTVNWGDEWEIGKNSFKPYACGIVLHPSIDVCIALRQHVRDFDEIERVELYVNPYVLELTGKKAPLTGLEGKFSVYYTAAVAFVEGDASQEQYKDDKIKSQTIVKMSERIVPIVVGTMKEHEAKGKLVLKNGKEFEHVVAFATGSKENPMSDERIQHKFKKVTQKILKPEQTEKLIGLLLTIEKQKDVHEMINCSYGDPLAI